MPNYEYRCVKCGSIKEETRKIEDRKQPTGCPECGWTASLIISRTARPKFGVGVKGNYSREANNYVRSETAGRNEDYKKADGS